MSISIPAPLTTDINTGKGRLPASRLTLPIYLYAVSLAALLTVVGVLWDISWHRSIGRDKFLSPPHILIYLGAIFAGLFSGLQVLYNSFYRKDASKATDIRVWGIFYSSLGSLFCIWGAIAMLTSAPFDDWWHNAYGLDVTILSPPHTLLAMGMIFLQFGACVSIAKYLNVQLHSTTAASPSPSAQRYSPRLRLLFLVDASSLLVMIYTLMTDYLLNRRMRTPIFYDIAAVASLLFLPAFGRALRLRWGMTTVALGYFLIVAGSNWILQLFPAEPKLGPILNHITHFQSGPFPLLVIIPAAAMDLIAQRSQSGDWLKALLMSVSFVALLFAVQYPLSGFLLESAGSRNWFFGGDAGYFGDSPTAPWRHHFWKGEIAPAPDMALGLLLAVTIGCLCARISLRWGNWLQSIQR